MVVTEKEPLSSQVAPAPDSTTGDQPGADCVLPETAGDSAAFLLAGLLAMVAGLMAVFLSFRKI